MNLYQDIIISLRRFRSEKINTLISLSGLVLALGIVAIILVYILNEVNYNSHLKNKDHIYRVLNHDKLNSRTWGTTPYQICELSKEQFSEVEDATFTYNLNNVSLKKDNEYIKENDVIGTTKSFFNVFGIRILQGKLDGFRQDRNQIYISSDISQKYFGNENSIGKNIKMKFFDVEQSMQVAAVFENIPKNNSIRPDIIVNTEIAFEELEKSIITSGHKVDKEGLKKAWLMSCFTNYFLVKETGSIALLNEKLQKLGKTHSKENKKLNLSLQSLYAVYFHSSHILANSGKDQGNITNLIVIGILAILILSIACINYLNLAMAQTITKLKSIAVRKTYGASQKDILKQFILDYCLLSILALPFAIAFAQLSLPYASELLDKDYILNVNADVWVGLFILIGLTIATGVITASATFVKFKKTQLSVMLKGLKSKEKHKFPLHKAMIVFQLSIFIVLTSTTILIKKQVNYAFNIDLGFAKEELVNLPIGDRKKEILKQKLSKIPAIKSVSSSMWLPPTSQQLFLNLDRIDRTDEKVSLHGLFVDYDFAKTMGIKILKGEDFQENKHQSGVLVNESAVALLGLTDIIGEETSFGTVLGLIDNFHMFSLRKEIPPMMIILSPSSVKQMVIRVSTKNVKNTIQQIEKVYNSTDGTTPFMAQFTNNALNELYKSDICISKIIGMLAFIAILIASLGLLGLSLFIGKQKTKEIGVRKTNGAKTIEIVKMLNQDILKLVLIAFILASPIAWYLMKLWLQEFAYKTELSLWIFALAGSIAVVIAMFTVTWQSWRAAKRNPVESLRYE